MSLEELQRRLEVLALGEAEMLTRAQFDQVFARGNASPDEQKLAAAALGESKGCRVLFTGQEAIYAIFTRRQRRGELRLGGA
jgi:hypothetical protein